MAFVSETHLTVRYAETDMMGIVHHSRYYPWFEVARTDFIKKIGYELYRNGENGDNVTAYRNSCKVIITV